MNPFFLLVLIVLLPLVASLTTVLIGHKLGNRAHLPTIIGLVATAFIALSLLVTTAFSRGHAVVPRPVDMVTPQWQWVTVEDAYTPANDSLAAVPGTSVSSKDAYVSRPFSISISLRLDPFTATMLTIITSIGLLVAIYSINFMAGDPGYPRFFALISMLIFSISMLVSVSNFLLIYIFWEAVNACHYLLIGFWYQKPKVLKSARKSFVTNRIGNFGLAVGIFLLWLTYGTLDFHDTLSPDGTILPGILGQTRLADTGGYVGGILGSITCLLLLLAACAKSAQLPLHVWLPDTTECPAPASALIHATTVTAGVYLVARSAPLFMACPGALITVSIIGTTTALVAALIGTVQNDLKRVLAYSTISQLGYMFACLGTGTILGFTAAIFHLLTHAFFKALLFLGTGSVMHSMGGVIDMRRFGGLRKLMPITATTFLIGSLALAGIAPFAGFFSENEILASLYSKGWPDVHHSVENEHHAMIPELPSTLSRTGTMHDVGYRGVSNYDNHSSSNQASDLIGLDVLNQPAVWKTLFWMALVTAGLTAFYTFRAVFMTFTGPLRIPDEAGDYAHESPSVMTTPLLILAIPATFIGYILFTTDGLSHFLAATPSFTTPTIVETAKASVFHWDLAIQGTLAAALGIVIAAVGHLGRRSDGPQLERWLGPVRPFLEHRMFIDQLYTAIFVKPIEAIAFLAAIFDRSFIDRSVRFVAHLPLALGSVVRQLQSGLLQRYALAGVIGILAIIVFLAWRL